MKKNLTESKMNNVLAVSSECSSGSESGWTLYLEHSFLSANPQPTTPINGVTGHGKEDSFFDDRYRERRGKDENEEGGDEEDEEEEEDLSMVSDASSGPPHFQEDNQDRRYFVNGDFNNERCETEYSPAFPGGGKRQLVIRNREQYCHRRREEDQELPGNFLDDTASSPLFNFSNNNFSISNNQASLEGALDYSQGFSATHFQSRRSTFQHHFGFFQSSQLPNNQWF